MEPNGTGTVEDQSGLIRALLTPECFPHPVSSIEVFETHISWVITTGPFAYKIKKSINLGFLDFSSLQRRKHFCDEEVRLNQQWAPELYLEVVAICGSLDRPSLAGDGVAIEYAVKMVQFPQSAQLDNQLKAGLLHEKDLYELAETVAGYHRKARVIEYAGERESVKKVKVPMLDNFAPVEQAIDMDLLTRVQQWTSTSLHELKPSLVERRNHGFVRECHGDLHLANLVRLSRGIVAFDCVEFSADLRNIDVLSDIAFLVMDLVAGARQDLAYAFLNRYLECTGDYDGMRVFGLYFVYHCMIRAKVAAIRSTERVNSESRRHDLEGLKHNLAVAIRWIEAPAPRLLAMHGYSGSGKTWLSSQLMTQFPAIRLRSDVERKRLFGLDETASSDSKPGKGIYTGASSKRVYEVLIEKAGRLLSAGLSVIIDASFLRRADRQLLAALAEAEGLDYAILDTSASRGALEERLQNRRSDDTEASEATVEILERQLDTADPLTAAEVERTVRVATDRDVDIGNVIKSLRSLSQ